MLATKRIEFDAGHRVPGHTGACRNPHGHHYAVEVTIDGIVQDDGMTVDFGIMKRLLMEFVHDTLDHSFICWLQDPLLDVLVAAGEAILPGEGFRVVGLVDPPTAENLASWVAGQIGDELAAEGVRLVKVQVWETPTASAVWEAERWEYP